MRPIIKASRMRACGECQCRTVSGRLTACDLRTPTRHAFSHTSSSPAKFSNLATLNSAAAPAGNAPPAKLNISKLYIWLWRFLRLELRLRLQLRYSINSRRNAVLADAEGQRSVLEEPLVRCCRGKCLGVRVAAIWIALGR